MVQQGIAFDIAYLNENSWIHFDWFIASNLGVTTVFFRAYNLTLRLDLSYILKWPDQTQGESENQV